MLKYLDQWKHLEEDGWQILEEHVRPERGDECYDDKWVASNNWKSGRPQDSRVQPYRRRVTETNTNTTWVIISGEIFKHIGTKTNGVAVLENRGGHLNLSHFYHNLTYAPAACTGFDWKDKPKELKVGCKTITIEGSSFCVNGKLLCHRQHVVDAIVAMEKIIPTGCELREIVVAGFGDAKTIRVQDLKDLVRE